MLCIKYYLKIKSQYSKLCKYVQYHTLHIYMFDFAEKKFKGAVAAQEQVEKGNRGTAEAGATSLSRRYGLAVTIRTRFAHHARDIVK